MHSQEAKHPTILWWTTPEFNIFYFFLYIMLFKWLLGGLKNNNNNHYTYLIFSCLIVNKLSPSLVSISCTETCNKYSVTVIFLLYFIQVRYITTIFQNIPNSILVQFWWNFYQQNVRSENVCNFLWLFLNIFWKHRF